MGFIKPNFSLHLSHFMLLWQLIELGNARELFLWLILNIYTHESLNFVVVIVLITVIFPSTQPSVSGYKTNPKGPFHCSHTHHTYLKETSVFHKSVQY